MVAFGERLGPARPAPGLAVLALAAPLAAWLPRPAAADGHPLCSCVSDVRALGHSQYLSGNSLLYTPAGTSTTYDYPQSYGVGCAAHDLTLPPSCMAAGRPAWCSSSWCYVQATCSSSITKTRSRYFPDASELYFSYETCAGGAQDAGGSQGVGWSAEDVLSTKNLIEKLEGYNRAARRLLEDFHADLVAEKLAEANDTDLAPACVLSPDRDMCPGDPATVDCNDWPDWASCANFEEVGVLRGPNFDNGTAEQREQRDQAVCMSDQIRSAYISVAGMESNSDRQHVGYQYYADRLTGSYTQWPLERACSWSGATQYDPRFRPWYAAGATGPKDIVIAVDVSGSMQQDDRMFLAKAATKKILDTLTWKDHASIILFNHAIVSIYSSWLVPVTDSARASMKSWADDPMLNWASGGTNFRWPMVRAFQLINDSIATGATSMCQKAIMFLTDGDYPSFAAEDFAMVRSNSTALDVRLFTYALGPDADINVTKQLACENRGILYPIPDGASLSTIMASYYDYFVQGQEICSSSFVKYIATQGHQLYGSCMPFYDRSRSALALLGVSCMDVNLIADFHRLRETSSVDHFRCQVTDMTKQCRSLDLTEAHHQKIRLAVGPSSVCEAHAQSDVAAETPLPCQDQNCQDDPTFRDELNYFCDTWIGDDCVNPNPMWHYSLTGLAAVRQHCRRSCGLCEWQDPCPRLNALECPVITVQPECRACLGRTSGVDIEEQPMLCPLDAPRDLMSTSTERPVVNTARRRSGVATPRDAMRAAAVVVALALATAELSKLPS